MDIIYALATARGKAGVAIVRMSGFGACKIASRFVGELDLAQGKTLRNFCDLTGELIDQVLVLVFVKDHSFTGEEVVEFQLHGAPAIVAAVLRCLADQEHTRLAEPGEFTRRALINDCLDLAQVEGLGDLIEAETEAQRVQAMRVFSGALGDKVETWRGRLVHAAALLEATIDFADEEVPVDVSGEVFEILESVQAELQIEADGVSVAERVRDGFEVAIVGAPNAGKSTLLNRIAQREAAIVSEIPGTTRDVIEVRMDLSGLPVTFLDTAGLRDSLNAVEIIGINRAKERARTADLRILFEEGYDKSLFIKDDIIVSGKADLALGEFLSVSGKTGEGVDELLQCIAQTLAARVSRSGIATKERHRIALVSGIEHLNTAINVLRSDGPDEIVAECLRRSAQLMDALLGRIDVENILDEVFATFCLGK